MNVTVIADPVLPVPPTGYGGAERVIASLCDTLKDRGHRVTLVAKSGSRRYHRLIPHAPPDNASLLSRAGHKLAFQPLSVAAALGADVVHNFGRVDYLFSLLRTRVPLVHTFENPIAAYELDILLRRPRPHLALVSVSDHQRAKFDDRARFTTIYNAVDVQRFTYQATPSQPPYLAFLGRLTRNKGVHLAIDVAERAGLPLRIAGNISKEPGGEEFFEREVKPRLRGNIEWVGELNDTDKIPFLGGATALLFPIQWDEPFAVVIGETLACGTPVVAWRRASTPEALRDGETGFLCDSVDEMVSAVARVGSVSRARCREFAERVLSSDVMARRYVELYERVIRE